MGCFLGREVDKLHKASSEIHRRPTMARSVSTLQRLSLPSIMIIMQDEKCSCTEFITIRFCQ